MKKRFNLFGIAVLVVAIGFFVASCNLFGNDYEMLNGVWDRGDIVVTFNDSNGVFTQINSNSGWQPLLNNGTISIGDRKFRNLRSSGNLKWTGQELLHDSSWQNCTITMDANGQTIRIVTENMSNSPTTYTRK